ncbi:hypothetical protein OH76DRAFT_82969 [Lentinus brumalis]|uniref:Uncharacterized protein n=1 Tax=Lentinus brumalis TaxID=2498619 RepID=A0A371DL42_9APHY|nr:hypothetical protein OH76DRAFT_82969 [Polyporus brumalis]
MQQDAARTSTRRSTDSPGCCQYVHGYWEHAPRVVQLNVTSTREPVLGRGRHKICMNSARPPELSLDSHPCLPLPSIMYSPRATLACFYVPVSRQPDPGKWKHNSNLRVVLSMLASVAMHSSTQLAPQLALCPRTLWRHAWEKRCGPLSSAASCECVPYAANSLGVRTSDRVAGATRSFVATTQVSEGTGA